MKRYTLIQMARQAGLEFVNQWHPLIEKFEKFALLVAEYEREECAELAGKVEVHYRSVPDVRKIVCAIQSRGGK